MCHHVDSYRWEERTRVNETDDAPEDIEEPAFLVEKPAEDVDLLTDGGDEE